MTQQRRVQCVFYSHVWTVHLLKQAPLGALADAVLIELAEMSHLAPVFRAQKQERYGLAGLLAFNDCIDKIGTRHKNLPAPLVLAPNPVVTASAMEAAVSLLPTAAGPYSTATLLVHVNDAATFANAYQHVDEFHVLWDIADLPTLSLTRVAETLAEQRCLDGDRWRGFHLCEHPMRPVEDGERRRETFAGLMQEFPTLAAAA